MDEFADLGLYLAGLVVAGLVGAFVFGIGQHIASWVWHRLTSSEDIGEDIEAMDARVKAAFEAAQKAYERLEERVVDLEGEEND